MYLADYHTHTLCSPDARNSMAEMAAAAAEAGLDEICFTDHVEPLEWNMTVLRTADHDWAPAVRAFAEAGASAGGAVRLRLGAELGDAPWDFAWAERQLERAPDLDCVIGSIHSLPPPADCNLALFSPAGETEALAGLSDYLRQVERMVRWGKFQVVGHLTLPLRYLNERRGFHLTFDGFEAEIEAILRLAAEKGLGIEVNTNHGKSFLPDGKWLRMYRQLGGEIITLGSDAHRVSDVGYAIREGQELLAGVRLPALLHLDRGEPVWHHAVNCIFLKQAL